MRPAVKHFFAFRRPVPGVRHAAGPYPWPLLLATFHPASVSFLALPAAAAGPVSNPLAAVLPVFFGKVGVGVVDRFSFEVMRR